jgi:hypothetical protein
MGSTLLVSIHNIDMKYIHYFETRSQYTTAKAAVPNSDPWISYLDSDDLLTYSPEINSNGYSYVDLGLPSGTLWATCNIGASNPEDAGDYYAWGEIETKSDYSWDTYKWGTQDNLTKYNSTDGLTTLELEDDAAHVVMGGDWIMPSFDDIDELVNYANGETTELNGVYVLTFTGTNGNKLYFPLVGHQFRTWVTDSGSLGLLSKSLINMDNQINPGGLTNDPDGGYPMTFNGNRSYGYSVRGVLSRRWYGELLL